MIWLPTVGSIYWITVCLCFSMELLLNCTIKFLYWISCLTMLTTIISISYFQFSPVFGTFFTIRFNDFNACTRFHCSFSCQFCSTILRLRHKENDCMRIIWKYNRFLWNFILCLTPLCLFVWVSKCFLPLIPSD